MEGASTELQTESPDRSGSVVNERVPAFGAQWARFVEASFKLDLLKTRYRAFYQVNGFTHPKLDAQTFLIA